MKLLGKIVSVIYSIIFTIALFGISISLFASNLLKGSFYTDLLKNVDLKEISASDLGLTDSSNENLHDYLVNELTQAGLDKNVSNTILNNSEIKEVVGNVIEQVINYSINKENVPKITEAQMKKVLNNKDVKQLIGENLTGSEVSELTKELNKFLKEFADNGGLNGN